MWSINNNPIAVMSPARRIAVFDPHSWSILGIEPTKEEPQVHSRCIRCVRLPIGGGVSLRIELEDGMLLRRSGTCDC